MRRKLLSLQFLGQTDWSSINFHVICWIFCHYKWYVKWYIPLLHGFDYDWFWMNCFYIFFFISFTQRKCCTHLFFAWYKEDFCFYLLINALIKFIVNVIWLFICVCQWTVWCIQAAVYRKALSGIHLQQHQQHQNTNRCRARQCRLNYECLRCFCIGSTDTDWVIWMKWKPRYTFLVLIINKCYS